MAWKSLFESHCRTVNPESLALLFWLPTGIWTRLPNCLVKKFIIFNYCFESVGTWLARENFLRHRHFFQTWFRVVLPALAKQSRSRLCILFLLSKCCQIRLIAKRKLIRPSKWHFTPRWESLTKRLVHVLILISRKKVGAVMYELSGISKLFCTKVRTMSAG